VKLALSFQPPRSSRLSSAGQLCRMFRRGFMNGRANSLIRSAAADVAAERIVYVRVAWLRIFRQQRSGRHNHAHLAITALRHLLIEPRRLHGVASIGRQPFDRGDISSSHRRDPRRARASRLAIHMYRARAAERHAAAEFGARKTERIAQHPKQRRIGRYFHRLRLPIYSDRNRIHEYPLVPARQIYVSRTGIAIRLSCAGVLLPIQEETGSQTATETGKIRIPLRIFKELL